MPALLLSALSRPSTLSLGLGLSLGISSFFAAQSILNTQTPARYALRCDAGMLSSSGSGVAGNVGDMLNRVGVGAGGYERYEREAKTPVTKGGRLNPGAVRQMSVGSIAGLLSGLTVSLFSKPLALLLGLLVLGIQGLEYQGIHIVPYGRLQRWFTNTDVKSALRDNVALKVSFGTAFALAGFVSL